MVDKIKREVKDKPYFKRWIRKWVNLGFTKYSVEGYTYMFPPLINRTRCATYQPKGGCVYCGNNTFRFYSKSGGKKYYQCEACAGINH